MPIMVTILAGSLKNKRQIICISYSLFQVSWFLHIVKVAMALAIVVHSLFIHFVDLCLDIYFMSPSGKQKA